MNWKPKNWAGRLGLTAAALALLLCAGVALSVLGSITHHDAVARLDVTDPSGRVVFARPTHLFKISADGRHIFGPLCDLSSSVEPRTVPASLEFTNLLGEWLPFLVRLSAQIEAVASPDGAVSDYATPRVPAGTTRLAWNAHIDQLDSATALDRALAATFAHDRQCEAKIADLLAGGNTVCTVSRVYRHSATGQILAVAFDTRCLAPCLDRDCRESGASVELPNVGAVPFTARAKNWLGLIDVRRR